MVKGMAKCDSPCDGVYRGHWGYLEGHHEVISEAKLFPRLASVRNGGHMIMNLTLRHGFEACWPTYNNNLYGAYS